MKKILSILCAILTFLTLTGCSSSPKSVVNDYMKELKSSSNKGIKEYVEDHAKFGLEEENKVVEKLYKLVADFDYSVEKETVNGDQATVEVNIKAYNINEVVTTFMSNYLNWTLENILTTIIDKDKIIESMLQIFDEAIEEVKKDGRSIQTTIIIPLNKVDKKWIIDTDACSESILNAITGGLKDSVFENYK